MDKYLNDDFGEKFAQSFLFDIAAEVLVAESQFEFQSFWHVGDARVGPLFGVQFAGEDAVGLDTDDHVGRSAIDSDIVTRRQLVRCRLRNFQIGILILRPTATTKYPNWIEIEKSTTAESFWRGRLRVSRPRDWDHLYIIVIIPGFGWGSWPSGGWVGRLYRQCRRNRMNGSGSWSWGKGSCTLPRPPHPVGSKGRFIFLFFIDPSRFVIYTVAGRM